MRTMTNPALKIAGSLLILIGIISIFNPVGALAAVASYIGALFIIIGIMYLVNYARVDSRKKPDWLLTQGITDILFGILLMLSGSFFAFAVAFIIAIWAFVTGVLRVRSALELKKAYFKNWGILFIIGSASIIFSVLVFAHPIIGAGIAGFYLGLMFISLGLGSLAQCYIL